MTVLHFDFFVKKWNLKNELNYLKKPFQKYFEEDKNHVKIH